MKNRRDFLRLSALAAAFLSVKRVAGGPVSTTSTPVKPIVLSTWNFGVPANAEAWKILSASGSALDAVETGIRVPEADPNITTVGFGGAPDRDGRVTLDACIMDDKMNCGAVAFLEHIKHPISVARMVMEKTPHVMIAGEGALKFALENGFNKENLLTPESEAAWKEWLKKAEYKPVINWENHDTIGMLAIDTKGNISGGCSTSGMAYKMHGRIGDSPIIGAGLYVDNQVGAATSSGVGEEVIRISGSHLVVELMRQGRPPEEACWMAIERIVQSQPQKSRDIQVGFLAVNKAGEFGSYSLQKGFQYAVLSEKNNNQLFDGKSFY